MINGGAIPSGWQPQAVPYHGVGPDGRPLTMYFAPTYVFTYQSGPPVIAVPPPTRGPASAGNPSYGWNYQVQGAAPVPVSLPPQAVTAPAAQWGPSNVAPPPGVVPQR